MLSFSFSTVANHWDIFVVFETAYENIGKKSFDIANNILHRQNSDECIIINHGKDKIYILNKWLNILI